MQDLVSIIIPAYNSERWIVETIKSALAQTWSQKEIIIVDDGSTDNTLAIAKSFESRLLKVVQQPNKGASAARNKGLSLAQGSYIQWLDADDLLAPTKIMNQLKHAESGDRNKTLLTSSFGTFYFCRERAKFHRTGLWQDLSPVNWLLNKFNERVWMNPASWLVSRKLTAEVGPWHEGLVRDNDGEYVCRVVAASEHVKFVPQAISYYRICNLNSLSYSLSEKAFESMVKSLELSFKQLLSLENSDRSRRACLNFMQLFVPIFYPEKKHLLGKLESIASDLGGQLEVPTVSWKYAIPKAIFGWQTTKKVMRGCARMKFRLGMRVDGLLCGLLCGKHSA